MIYIIHICFNYAQQMSINTYIKDIKQLKFLINSQ